MSKVDTIYFIHHSHTEIGYTHDHPIVWDLHQRFIDEALELAHKYADNPGDGAFRWTVETTGVLYRWLQHASPQQLNRFTTLEQAGRIEVTGMFANITPLYDLDQLVESFQLLRLLQKEFGFTIRHAMNCDVNGENWPLVEVLLDLGIEAFTMAINTHFGGAPLQRPQAFWWQGPSGRKILAWNGWPYDTGWRFGIGHDTERFEQVWWPRVEQHLAKIDYSLPVLMVQSYHPFGDNGSAFEGFSQFIDRWNEQGKSPRLCMATPQLWWAAVKEHSHLLPTYRGDWTDYWNFGCISSAREQTMNRVSRIRLRSADALAAVIQEHAQTGWTARSFSRYREPAWHALHWWDEHTWGADCSMRAPYSEDTASQWHHKANYAYTARSLSLLLQRDALADFARQVERTKSTDLLIFNPLPWPRLITGHVPGGVESPRGVPVDTTAGRHFQDRLAHEGGPMALALETLEPEISGKHFVLKPVEVPGFGYRVTPHADLVELRPTAVSEAAVVENERYRLTFNLERGGILSWYDKQLDREWVDQSVEYPFNGFVHETVADRSHPWPRKLMFDMIWEADEVERPSGWKPDWPFQRSQPAEVLDHRVYGTPVGRRVVQRLQAPGCAGPLVQSVFLPDRSDQAGYIECESWWELGLDAHPEATYLLFPFNIPGATARLDVGGQAMVAGVDQLPGVCRDYFTAQQWVDFSNEELGVTVALPENPMIQLGDFHFGHYQTEFRLERALLLGWVTNNYWETNFRAHQPGQVRARYRILPHQGGFNEAQAHRFGLEAANADPLLQHMGEPTGSGPLLPGQGMLLSLPGNDSANHPILTLHVKPAADPPGIIVRLLNASDEEQQAQIGSGLLRIIAAQLCNLLEEPQQVVAVQNGLINLNVPPRRVATIRLNVRKNDDSI